jgi:hypothetical protein
MLYLSTTRCDFALTCSLLDFTPILDASVQASVGVDSRFMKNRSLVHTDNLQFCLHLWSTLESKSTILQ